MSRAALSREEHLSRAALSRTALSREEHMSRAERKTAHLPQALYDYLLTDALREPKILSELRAETAAHPLSLMAISPEQGAFMSLLVQFGQVSRILEIGVFTGYSSTAMALVLPPDGELTALDISAEFTDVARRYWQRAGVADRVDLRLAPALETLTNLHREKGEGFYDLCFIDADKTGYDAYYEHCLKLTRRGGMLLFDNAFAMGGIVDGQGEQEQALRALNEKVRDDERVDMCLATVGDGLLMCRVRA